MSLAALRLPHSGTLVNFLLFQLCWLACVLGAAAGQLWPGLLAVAALVVFQSMQPGFLAQDVPLLLIALPVGFALDSLLVASGIMAYATPWPSVMLAPLWIMLLWLAFPLTLNHSLGWLRGRPLLAALGGGIGSPLSYYAGHQFGAVLFPRGTGLALLIAAASWAVLVPLLCQYAHHRRRDHGPGERRSRSRT